MQRRFVHCVRYFSVQVLKRADSKGLIESLNNALKMFEIDDVLDKANVLGVDEQAILVGGGTDGASVNIAEQNGMKGRLWHGFFGHGAMLIIWN